MDEIMAFPDDDKIRTIIGFGKLKKNTSGNSKSPLVEAIMRPLKREGGIERFDEREESYYIAHGEVTIARIGSVWRGQERLRRYWQHPKYQYEKRRFKINLADHPAKNFIFNKNKKMIEIKDNIVSQADEVYHTTFTSLMDVSGNTIFIPCVELFTSTYLPRNIRIREELYLNPSETVRRKYVKEYKCEKDVTTITTRHKYMEETIAFLAYLSCDETSKSNISSVWSSLQAGFKISNNGDTFSYLLAKPYHPNMLEFEVSGYWYKEKVFFVQRVMRPEPPADKKIEHIFEKAEYDKADDDRPYPRPNDEEEEEASLITGALAPGGNIGVNHVLSDIAPNNKNLTIFHKERKVQVTTKRYAFKRKDVVNKGQYSSGELSGDKESEGVGRVAYDTKDDYEPAEDEETDIYKMLFGALKEFVEYSAIKKFTFIDENGESVEEVGYCTSLRARRQMVLVQVEIPSGEKKYIIEIERRAKGDSFRGACFVFEGGINRRNLKRLLKAIEDNSYRLNKLGLKSLSVGEFNTFKHRKQKRVMYAKLKMLLGV